MKRDFDKEGDMVNTHIPLVFRGLSIQRLHFQESLQHVWNASLQNPVRVFWANAHSINLSEKNIALKQALQQSEFLLNDGVGVEIAGRVFGKKMPSNLNGTDWIPAFLDFIQKQNTPHSIFLLGSKQAVISSTTRIFSERWPQLDIVGTHDGYFSNPEIVLKKIEQTNPFFLIVGMGVPAQELFITQNWERLKLSGVRIAIGGGAIFDFLSGAIPRAPSFLRHLRLEWIYRFLLEPQRLAKRYFIGNPAFLYLVLKERLSSLIKSYFFFH